MSLLVLITLTMGGQLIRAQVHTAPRPSQATDSKLCVGTLKAYKVKEQEGKVQWKQTNDQTDSWSFILQEIKNGRYPPEPDNCFLLDG